MANEIIALLMKKMNVKENQIFHIVGEGNIFGQREMQYFFKDNCLYRKTMFGNDKSFEILGRLIEQEYPIIVMQETKELMFDAEQARQVAIPREKQLKQECIDVTMEKTLRNIYNAALYGKTYIPLEFARYEKAILHNNKLQIDKKEVKSEVIQKLFALGYNVVKLEEKLFVTWLQDDAPKPLTIGELL